jgi:16S rRNA C1402 (ribose-2'-O) methylase RsmI
LHQGISFFIKEKPVALLAAFFVDGVQLQPIPFNGFLCLKAQREKKQQEKESP